MWSSSCIAALLLAAAVAALRCGCAAAATAVDGEASYPLYNYTYICDPERYQKLGLNIQRFPFCNRQLPYRVRAAKLVNVMSLGEKAAQMGSSSAGVGRLGIPAYNWWGEALHGVSDFGGGARFGPAVPGATSFPSPILSAAAFNESLWKAVGEAVSTEARAMHNEKMAGLTFWSPNINVARDPRWGRILETPGEDPYVVGRYAVNYVRGLQDVKGHDAAAGDLYSRPLKVSSCCKHYTAYDLDRWHAGGNFVMDRFQFSANVTEQDMVETFQRPFEMCVRDGDASSVMCSYNQVNGFPTCSDSRLLRGTLRNEWNLHGYIVSDCGAIKTIVNDQKFLNNVAVDAVGQSIEAGLNLDCGDYYQKYLVPAVKAGRVKESDIDDSLVENYVVLMRLGLFDGNPLYNSLGKGDVCTGEHINLSLDAARQGMTLLENHPKYNAWEWKFPLQASKHQKIAVVGPHAEATDAMLGNYNGKPCKVVSPAEGLRRYAQSVVTSKGCLDVACKTFDHFFNAEKAVRNADATIIVAGLDTTVEAEGLDRADLQLPGYQKLLINQVSRAAKGANRNQPVMLVLFSAGPLDVDELRKNKNIDAIMWAGYPGEQGGNAIADVIYGAYNPGGRLPVTWYHGDYVFKLPMTSMNLRPDEERSFPGRTYRFNGGSNANNGVIYEFGYGISYTWFSYKVVSSQKHVQKNLPAVAHCHPLDYDQSAYAPPCQAALLSDLDCRDGDVVIDVEVTNPSNAMRAGAETVILFHRPPKGIVGAPIKKVVGFKKTSSLRLGQSETLRFTLNSCEAFGVVTGSGYEVLPAGEHHISVGLDYSEVNFPFHVYLNNELSDLTY